MRYDKFVGDRQRGRPVLLQHVCKTIISKNDNLRIRTLTFNRSCCIGSEAVAILADALALCTHLKELDLFANEIGDTGAEALAQALKVNTSLRKLDLGRNVIGDTGAQAFASCLAVNTTLLKLDLSENIIGDRGITAIAEGLKINTGLRELKLRENRPRDLNIDDMKIGDAGMAALGECLKINTRLRTLFVPRITEDFITAFLVSRVVVFHPPMYVTNNALARALRINFDHVRARVPIFYGGREKDIRHWQRIRRCLLLFYVTRRMVGDVVRLVYRYSGEFTRTF